MKLFNSEGERLDVHVYLHQAESPKLDMILASLIAMQKGSSMSQATLDDLLAEVTRQGTIAAGAKSLLEQLYQMRSDPQKLQATLEGLKANDDLLEAALVTNTPQAAA